MNREEEFDLDLTGTTDDFDETAPHAAYAGPDAAHGTDAAPARNLRADTGPSRGPSPWLALGAALVVVGIVAAPGPPGEQVGIIDRVAEPQQQWQVDVGFDPEYLLSGLPDNPSLLLTEDALIYYVSTEVQARDLDDGRELWAAEGTQLQCHLTDPVILCASGAGTDAELLRLDVTDGELDRTPSPGLLSALAVDDDVITIRVEGGGTLVAREDDLGERLWSHELFAGEPGSDDDLLIRTWLHLAGDKILVGLWGGLGARGAILTADTGLAEDTSHVHMVQPNAMSSLGPWSATTVEGWMYPIDTDGELGERRPAWSVTLSVDDDLGSDVWFEFNESGAAAHSAGSTEPIWERELDAQPLTGARLGEVLVVQTGEGALGLDLQSGADAWQRQAAATWPIYSDGEVLVHIEYHNDREPRLVGIDSRSGAETFGVPFPGDITFGITLEEEKLALLTDQGLTLMTW